MYEILKKLKKNLWVVGMMVHMYSGWFGKLRQKNCHKFEASLAYIARLRLQTQITDTQIYTSMHMPPPPRNVSCPKNNNQIHYEA